MGKDEQKNIEKSGHQRRKLPQNYAAGIKRKGSGGIVKQASEKTTPVVKMQEEELRVGDLDQYLFGQGNTL